MIFKPAPPVKKNNKYANVKSKIKTFNHEMIVKEKKKEKMEFEKIDQKWDYVVDRMKNTWSQSEIDDFIRKVRLPPMRLSYLKANGVHFGDQHNVLAIKPSSEEYNVLSKEENQTKPDHHENYNEDYNEDNDENWPAKAQIFTIYQHLTKMDTEELVKSCISEIMKENPRFSEILKEQYSGIIQRVEKEKEDLIVAQILGFTDNSNFRLREIEEHQRELTQYHLHSQEKVWNSANFLLQILINRRDYQAVDKLLEKASKLISQINTAQISNDIGPHRIKAEQDEYARMQRRLERIIMNLRNPIYSASSMSKDDAELEELIKEHSRVYREFNIHSNTLKTMQKELQEFDECLESLNPPSAQQLLPHTPDIFTYCRFLPSVGSEPFGMKYQAKRLKEFPLKLDSVLFYASKYEYFDRIFYGTASQEDVFNELSGHLLAACGRHNLTLFSYGSSGSGKSYTMKGIEDDHLSKSYKDKHNMKDICTNIKSCDISKDTGIIPRTIELVLKSGVSEVYIALIGYYNKRIIDLINSDNVSRDCFEDEFEPTYALCESMDDFRKIYSEAHEIFEKNKGHFLVSIKLNKHVITNPLIEKNMGEEVQTSNKKSIKKQKIVKEQVTSIEEKATSKLDAINETENCLLDVRSKQEKSVCENEQNKIKPVSQASKKLKLVNKDTTQKRQGYNKYSEANEHNQATNSPGNMEAELMNEEMEGEKIDVTVVVQAKDIVMTELNDTNLEEVRLERDKVGKRNLCNSIISASSDNSNKSQKSVKRKSAIQRSKRKERDYVYINLIDLGTSSRADEDFEALDPEKKKANKDLGESVVMFQQMFAAYCKRRLIPFRESPFTLFLMKWLSARNLKLGAILTLSPEPNKYRESLSTLALTSELHDFMEASTCSHDSEDKNTKSMLIKSSGQEGKERGEKENNKGHNIDNELAIQENALKDVKMRIQEDNLMEETTDNLDIELIEDSDDDQDHNISDYSEEYDSNVDDSTITDSDIDETEEVNEGETIKGRLLNREGDIKTDNEGKCGREVLGEGKREILKGEKDNEENEWQGDDEEPNESSNKESEVKRELKEESKDGKENEYESQCENGDERREEQTKGEAELEYEGDYEEEKQIEQEGVSEEEYIEGEQIEAMEDVGDNENDKEREDSGYYTYKEVGIDETFGESEDSEEVISVSDGEWSRAYDIGDENQWEDLSDADVEMKDPESNEDDSYEDVDSNASKEENEDAGSEEENEEEEKELVECEEGNMGEGNEYFFGSAQKVPTAKFIYDWGQLEDDEVEDTRKIFVKD